MSSSFFASPEFITLTLHSFIVFEIPIHILGFYCILFRTPISMNSVKWTMFNLHFWSVMMDIGYSIFTCPFLMLPALAGFALGLDEVLGIPIVVGIYILITLFLAVGIAIVSIFENRYYLLFGIKSWWHYARYPFLSLNYILALTCFILPILHVPEQKHALAVLEKKHPDIPFQEYSDRIFFMSIDHEYILISMSSISALIFIETVTFGLLLSSNLRKRTEKLSRKTYELQKSFLRAIVIQILTPVFVLFVPAVYFAFSVVKNYHNQAANNFCIIIIALHGSISTIVMLYIHEPYRKYCSNAFYGAFKAKKIESSIVTSVVK